MAKTTRYLRGEYEIMPSSFSSTRNYCWCKISLGSRNIQRMRKRESRKWSSLGKHKRGSARSRFVESGGEDAEERRVIFNQCLRILLFCIVGICHDYSYLIWCLRQRVIWVWWKTMRKWRKQYTMERPWPYSRMYQHILTTSCFGIIVEFWCFCISTKQHWVC